MGARSDFWLHVHKLAQCLEDEGANPGERQAAILAALADMPPIARLEVTAELAAVYAELNELWPHVEREPKPRVLPK